MIKSKIVITQEIFIDFSVKSLHIVISLMTSLREVGRYSINTIIR